MRGRQAPSPTVSLACLLSSALILLAVLPLGTASAWQVEGTSDDSGLAIANNGRVAVTGPRGSGIAPIARVYTGAGEIAFTVPALGQRGFADSPRFDADGNLYVVVRQPDFVGVRSYDTSGILRWAAPVLDAAHIPTLTGDGKVLVTAPNPPTVTALQPTTGAVAFTVPVTNHASIRALEYIHAFVGGFVSMVGRIQFFANNGQSLGDVDPPIGYETLASGTAAPNGSAYSLIRPSRGDWHSPLTLVKWRPSGIVWHVLASEQGIGEPGDVPPELAVLPNGNVAIGIGPSGGVNEGVTILSSGDRRVLGSSAFHVPADTQAVKGLQVDFSVDDRGNIVMTYNLRFGCSIAPCIGFQAELFDGATGRSMGMIDQAYDPEPSPRSWGFHAASKINAG